MKINLRKIRIAKRLSQYEVAYFLEMSQSQYSRLETKGEVFDERKIKLLIELFGADQIKTDIGSEEKIKKLETALISLTSILQNISLTSLDQESQS